MPEKIDIAYALRLPPEKAIEYFTAKGYKTTFRWSDMLAQAHAKAFTVAKVARMDVLQDIRGAVQKSLAEGQTLKQFRDNLEPVLKAKGWWGRQTMTDPLTGKEKIVQLGSPRRLRTIYRENLTDAYVTGDWQSAMENTADRPYGQWHCRKVRSRASHIALDGKVFFLSDPFWQTHVPGKLDWGCHCWMTTLSEEDLKDGKLKPESSAGKMSERQVLVSRATGELRKVPVYTDPASGVEVAAGVGRGYNPAMAAYQPDLNAYDYDIARDYIQGTVTGPHFGLFLDGKTGGQFPVAVLAEDFRNLIGAKSQTVLLSDATLLKNKTQHPELKLADYQGIQLLLEDAQLVVQDSGATMAFIKRGEAIYQAVVKTTESGQALYLTSLRRSSLQDAARMRNKGKVIRDVWNEK